MKRLLYLSILLTGMILANAQTPFEDIMFSARLDTLQAHNTLVVPSSGNGSSGFSYHNDSLWFDLTVNGLTGPITASHIHLGKTGVNGPVVYDLTPFVNGNKIKGVITGIVLGNGDVAKFLEGEYYVNVHTSANPAGEIRGQIFPETDHNFRAQLDLTQAGNPGNTAFGLATINLSLDQKKLEIRMLVNGLSGNITNSHLHYGAPGNSGPPVIPLMSYNSGNTFQGYFDISTLPDQAGFLDSLNQGKVYVNVHTAMYPAGEIRGQVYITRTLSFDTWMTSDEETGTIDPGTPVNARGLCNLSVTSSIDSILVYIQYDQLSGPVVGSHFHMGVAGMSGPIVVDLTPFLIGNQIVGVILPTSPELIGDIDLVQFLENILTGQIYVNAHTALNPAGEVRGQPDRLAREGVIFSLCPDQETGVVLGPKTAIGSGYISIDRNYLNLHYGMTASMLSTSVIGAHFHDGLPGAGGPVIFTLPTDSVITGFWNDDTFTAEIAGKFENGEIYGNFHTTLNPAGEIRGQVSGGDLCAGTTGITESGQSRNFSLFAYPNPAHSAVTFSFTIPNPGLAMIRVVNLLGCEVNNTVLGIQPAGIHTTNIDFSGLPDGIYYSTLFLNGSYLKTEKLILSR